jgi:hypothetical protein
MSASAAPGAMPQGGFGPPGWHPADPGGAAPRGWSPWALAWSVPKPWLILATVFAFIAFFPLGIAMLFFLIGTGRLFGRALRGEGPGMRPGMRMESRACGWRRGGGAAGASGNRAFDEYREDTLRRLEEEQREFAAFLERLRFARDKAEFDQFMADRRPRPEAPEPPPEPARAG